MRAAAVVPVKRFDAAKQRLSSALPPADRARLAAGMIADVLAAIARCEGIDRTLVVSGEPSIAETVAGAGAELVHDADDSGHSEAALLGVAVALRSGYEAVALLPGDCPLLEPAEIDDALAKLARGTVGVVPDRHGSGTNGLLLRPPDAIAPAFGPGSRERHLQLATEAGVAGTVLAIPSLGLDLDTGEDLGQLRALVGTGRLAGSNTAAALDAISLGSTGAGGRA